MGAIKELTNIDVLVVIMGFFALLFAVKEIIEIVLYFKNKFRIKTGTESDKESIESRITILEKHDKYQYNMLQEILQKLDDIKDWLNRTDKCLDEINVRNMRSEVLNFAASIINGQQHTIEEFNHIFSVINEYEKLVDTKNIPNGQLEHAIVIIKREYDKLMKLDGFLK